MDAPSPSGIACCSSYSALAAGFDEASAIASSPLPFSSCSLPPFHYLQTCPQLLTANSSLSSSSANNSSPSFSSSSYSSSRTLTSSQKSSRSTSSPQLMSAKTRSKVYRRASLKSSLSSFPPTTSPFHSRMVKLSCSDNNNDKKPKCMQSTKINCETYYEEQLDPLKSSVLCPYPSPIFQNNSNNNVEYDHQRNYHHRHNQQVHRHHQFPHHLQHQRHLHNNKLKNDSAVQQDNQKNQQSKVKSCTASFLPILSFIPHTVISFQYPTPKIKFSWWRNKIS